MWQPVPHSRFFCLAPSKFRLEATRKPARWENGSQLTEITWDGGPTCWCYTGEEGEIRDRTPGNALGMESVSTGPQVSFIPKMLMPKGLGESRLRSEYPEVTSLQDEKIDGRYHRVLKLRNRNNGTAKLWIDPTTNLIHRFYESDRDITVTFTNDPNVPVTSKDLSLGKRKPFKG